MVTFVLILSIILLMTHLSMATLPASAEEKGKEKETDHFAISSFSLDDLKLSDHQAQSQEEEGGTELQTSPSAPLLQSELKSVLSRKTLYRSLDIPPGVNYSRRKYMKLRYAFESAIESMTVSKKMKTTEEQTTTTGHRTVTVDDEFYVLKEHMPADWKINLILPLLRDVYPMLASPPKEMEEMRKVASRHAKWLSRFWDVWSWATLKANYPKPNIDYILELQSQLAILLLNS